MNHYLTPDSHKYQYYYDEKVNTCLLYESIGLFDWLGSMGTGITGMGELIIITLMAGGMLELR